MKCPVCKNEIEEGQEVVELTFGLAGYRERYPDDPEDGKVLDITPSGSSEFVHEECIDDYP